MDNDNVINLDDGGINKNPEPKAVKPTSAPSLRGRLDALLNGYSTEYYSFTLPSGKEIEIRPSVFEDEREAALESQRLGISLIEALERRVIKDFDPSKYPYYDELFILLKMRQISFGPKLELKPVTCQHCSEENIGLIVELDKLPVTVANPPLEGLIKEITLPATGHKAKVRIPSISDGDITNISQNNSNLFKLVVSIGEESDPYIIKEFVNKGPIADVKAMKSVIFDSTYGVDTTVNFECQHCRKVNTIMLPINLDFLPVS